MPTPVDIESALGGDESPAPKASKKGSKVPDVGAMDEKDPAGAPDPDAGGEQADPQFAADCSDIFPDLSDDQCLQLQHLIDSRIQGAMSGAGPAQPMPAPAPPGGSPYG